MEHIDGLIRAGLEQMGLAAKASPAAPALLDRYSQLLLEKNRVMNLTAITAPEDVAALHMLDCAALLGCAGFEGKTLIDVGTGAGFPGLALKILVPSLSVTLLDSLAKRLDWLEETAEDLGLSGVAALHARAEEAGCDPALRETFDFAAARAVADLRTLCELCLPFVRVGGSFLAMKGPEAEAELEAAQSAIARLGGGAARLYDYALPGRSVCRRVVVVEKIAATPERYPRRWAKIQNHPL